MGRKTLWEKKKLLLFPKYFQKTVLPTRKNQHLFAKGLNAEAQENDCTMRYNLSMEWYQPNGRPCAASCWASRSTYICFLLPMLK